MGKKERGGSLLWSPLLAIAATAFAVEIPFFFKGTPSGHDVEFHLYSWLEVLSQWKHGIWLPRWASMSHFAYGEPRFVFYPPASWTLGALLSAVFPWTLVSSIYIWIVLVAAGASMFLLARQWLDRRDAIFAAALYAANPYHLVIVYWRSAFAELLASCLLPLLVLLLMRTVKDGWRVLAPLSLLLAAAWLTNAPAAVMIHYSFALLIVLLAWRYRSARVLLVGGVAVVLGGCLAAFYLYPAIYEQRWINIAEAVSAGSRPADNFLFIHTTDADHDHFNQIISWLATAEISVTLAALWVAKQWRKDHDELWTSLATWAVGCSLLMFSISGLLWNILPKMRFMQFPWRWMLCLSFVLCLFLTIGVKRWWMRGVICLAMLMIIVAGWHRLQAPWWDTAADLREMQDNMIDGPGYEGTDEYTPRGADASLVDKDARRVVVDGPEHAAIRVQQWGAMSKAFVVDMSAPSKLLVHLFNYPAWQVEVNGHLVQTATRAGTGQMLILVEAGVNRVQINFQRTQDRQIGKWITLFALFVLLILRFTIWKQGTLKNA